MSEELTTYGKNYNEWKAAHPTRTPDRWVATTNRGKAARFISKQADKIREANLQAADDIIVSQEQTRKELKAEISSGVDDIVDGLEGMEATFEWGFSELVWQIEKQRETLEGILETLQKPLDTQAKELKERAEQAYENGWFDDALQDFLESEKKNRYDFTVHQNLGNIYFFHKGQPDKALEYYEKAAKYAKPESAYHASFALLHVALIKYLKEDFKEAYETTSKAIELSPLLYEAYYQHSRYCARVEEHQEAVYHLKKAIADDLSYALKANSEEDFERMEEKVTSLIEKLTKDAQQVAKKRMKCAKELIKKASQKDLTVDPSVKKEIEGRIKEITKLQKGGLYDCQNAVQTANQVYETAKSGLIAALESKIDDLEEQKESVREFSYFVDTPLRLAGVLSWLGAPFFGIAFIISMVDDNYSASTSWVFLILAVLCSLITWANLRADKREKKRKNDYKEKIEKLSSRLSSLETQSPESIEINREESWIKPVKQTEKTYNDFVATVDIKITTSGECGIQFRSGDNYDTYLYRIGDNGYYQLDLVQEVEAKENPNLTTLTEGFSFAIKQGDSWNKLKVKAVGPNIELYANGILLDAVSDKVLQKGGLDVVGSKLNTQSYLKILYDNFKINSYQSAKCPFDLRPSF